MSRRHRRGRERSCPARWNCWNESPSVLPGWQELLQEPDGMAESLPSCTHTESQRVPKQARGRGKTVAFREINVFPCFSFKNNWFFFPRLHWFYLPLLHPSKKRCKAQNNNAKGKVRLKWSKRPALGLFRSHLGNRHQHAINLSRAPLELLGAVPDPRAHVSPCPEEGTPRSSQGNVSTEGAAGLWSDWRKSSNFSPRPPYICLWS